MVYIKRFMSFRVNIWYFVALAIGFVVGYFSQPRPMVESTITTIDSTRYEFPHKFEVTNTEIRTLTIPKLVFAPRDTSTIVVTEYIKGDSVDVELPFERREYSDSTYRAVVSGVVVDNIHPTLESLDIYSRTITNTVVNKPPLFAPYGSVALGRDVLSFGAGVVLRCKHGFGVDYLNLPNDDVLAFRYTVFF